MVELLRCKRCGLPETYETIEFDAQGICNICRSTEHKQQAIDWDERKRLLDQIIAKHRGRYDYDCIIPFSGGKDSTFQLYYLVQHYGIKPLVIRFNHHFYRPTIEANVQRTLKQLGADMLEFTPNWRIVKRLMRESFLRKTDFCWHCHTGIYAYPLQMAIKFNVPLLFWGEPLAEISAYYDYLNDDIEYEDEKKFNMVRNLGISAADMQGMIDDADDPIDPRDLKPYTYPDLKELKRIQYLSLCLGSFIPWDYWRNSQQIQQALGWQGDDVEGVPRAINGHGEKIECFMQGTRDYIKYIKRGYSRTTQINAFHIRNSRSTLEQAHVLNQQEGKRPPSLDIFLDYIGIDEAQFNQIVTAQQIPPYQHDFSAQPAADRLWDFEQWYRENNRIIATDQQPAHTPPPIK